MPPRGMDPEAFPVRQPTMRPPRRTEGGRHRRAVPASLPQSAPALVLAVPGKDTDLSSGPAAELAAVLRVDNPAVDARGGPDDPSDLRAVLADATARRPDGGPCAVVIPLIATVNPPVIHRLRAAVAASGTNAIISGFINSNAMIAEVLHIRLAESGLARADRVRLFSIVTAADGVLIATVGGPDSMPVIASGKRLAKLLQLDRIARLKMFPIAIQVPWGISPALLPEIPLPTKIRTAFQPPIELDTDPARAEDGDYVEAKYDEVCAAIQSGMDALARRRRLPLFG